MSKRPFPVSLVACCFGIVGLVALFGLVSWLVTQ
jgi:hypothetical protein